MKFLKKQKACRVNQTEQNQKTTQPENHPTQSWPKPKIIQPEIEKTGLLARLV